MVITIAFALLACSDTTSEVTGSFNYKPDCPTGTAPYVGCWLTPGCQTLAANIPSVPVRWVKDQIYLNEQNEFRIFRQAYDDSSCSGPLAFSSLGKIYNFNLTNSVISASGLMEYQIQIDSNSQGATQTSYTVYMAATANDTLCLSDNWDVNNDCIPKLSLVLFCASRVDPIDDIKHSLVKEIFEYGYYYLDKHRTWP